MDGIIQSSEPKMETGLLAICLQSEDDERVLASYTVRAVQFSEVLFELLRARLAAQPLTPLERHKLATAKHELKMIELELTERSRDNGFEPART